MSAPADGRLDPRAWLLWGLAAGLPALLGRNPFPLLAALLAVVAVRAAWRDVGPGPRAASWGALVRLAAVFAAVGVVFNVLTSHYGDLVFARLPDALPIVGGPLTLNALVFGLLGGLALFLLVLTGATLGTVLDWSALLRLVPARLTGLAVAGAVAWTFVPQTVSAFRATREAQAARGYRLRGARDLLPLLVPLLGGGLERAVTLSETLESRGFGAPLAAAPPPRPWRGVALALGLALGAAGAYLLAAGRGGEALAVAGTAGVLLLLTARDGGTAHPRRTRYRDPAWTGVDTAIAAAAGLALAAQVLVLALDPAAFRYEPYPDLAVPRVNLPLLVGLALLLAPVAVVPVGELP